MIDTIKNPERRDHLKFDIDYDAEISKGQYHSVNTDENGWDDTLPEDEGFAHQIAGDGVAAGTHWCHCGRYGVYPTSDIEVHPDGTATTPLGTALVTTWRFFADKSYTEQGDERIHLRWEYDE